MTDEQVEAKLKGVFDTVHLNQDGDAYVARRAHDYPTRNEAVSDMKKRLEQAIPQAEIVYCGSVSDPRTRRVIQWYVEFTLAQ